MEEIYEQLDTIKDIDERKSFVLEILGDFPPEERNDFLSSYIQFEKKQMASFMSEKNHSNHIGDFVAVEKFRKRIKRSKRFIQTLREISNLSFLVEEKGDDSCSKDEGISYKSKSFVELFYERLIDLDEFCKTEFTKKLEEHEKNPLSLDALEEMKEKCTECRKYLKKLYSIAKQDNQDNLERIQYLRRSRKLLEDYINHSISIGYKLEKQEMKKNETFEEVFGQEEPLSPLEIQYVDAIIHHKNISIEDFPSWITILRKTIQYYPLEEVSSAIWKTIDLLNQENLLDSEKEKYYLAMMDTLRLKQKNTSKECKKEREEIRTVLENLRSSLKNINLSFVDEEQVLDYEVLEYCLDHVMPYYYLRRILSLKKDFAYFEKDGQSLITLVLQKYIESQKIELRNHRRDYIPKEYYRNFYQLLLHVSRLSKKTEEDISKIKEEFKTYLQNSKYKTENKNEAMFEFQKLLGEDLAKENFSFTRDISSITDNLKDLTPYLTRFGKKRTIFQEEYFQSNERKMEEFQEQFYQKYGEYPSFEMTVQMTGIPKKDCMNAFYHCATVTLGNSKTAYSLLQDGKGSNYLRMHVFDLTSYIHDGDEAEIYLRENGGERFHNEVSYTKNKLVPSITYQVKIFPNGNVGNLKIYPSVVEVSREYNSIDGYREDALLKSYIATYKKLLKTNFAPDNIEKFENTLRDFFEESVFHFCEEHAIPIILYGQNYPDEYTLMSIQGDLGPIFSKMSKSQFHFYSQILRDQIDKNHYTNRDFDKGIYNLKLESPSSYVDLVNQRFLLAYEKMGQDKNSLTTALELSNQVVDVANEKIGYVPEIVEKTKSKRRKSSLS